MSDESDECALSGVRSRIEGRHRCHWQREYISLGAAGPSSEPYVKNDWCNAEDTKILILRAPDVFMDFASVHSAVAYYPNEIMQRLLFLDEHLPLDVPILYYDTPIHNRVMRELWETGILRKERKWMAHPERKVILAMKSLHSGRS